MKGKNKRTKRIYYLKPASILILLFLTIVFTLGVTIHSNGSDEESIIIETVQADDTLWEIAEEYNPKGYDIRRFVAEIAKYNAIEDYQIYPGQEIHIPIP